MNDEYYMAEALKEAEKAFKVEEVPVGVVIVFNNEIVARGFNKREIEAMITSHAELIAIQEASFKLKDWRLNECVMYVTLFPCPMCASAIVQSRIKRIVVGAPTKDPKIREIVDLIFDANIKNNNLELTEGILEQECVSIIKKFFKKQRNK